MNVVDRLGVGLLERDDELAALNRLLDDAAAGEGALVLIEGPAGIGKTSLLDACGQGAANRGMAVLRAVGDQLLMGSSFAAVRELLFSAVRDEGSLFERAARLAARVFEPDATDSGDPDRTRSLCGGSPSVPGAEH
jgi:predicted ATPase